MDSDKYISEMKDRHDYNSYLEREELKHRSKLSKYQREKKGMHIRQLFFLAILSIGFYLLFELVTDNKTQGFNDLLTGFAAIIMIALSLTFLIFLTDSTLYNKGIEYHEKILESIEIAKEKADI